jgi:clan AA aspartic protease
MLTGRVTSAREAMVPITVHGPDGARVDAEATIDTGFDGYVALPPSVVTDLELPFAGRAVATLGDGSTTSLDLFLAGLEWHDGLRDVLVLAADGGTLLGMAILAGSRLTVDVVEDGAVTLAPL